MGPQAVGQFPVDVIALGCGFSTPATATNGCMGPKGTGFLYLRQERLDEVCPTHVRRWLLREAG